MITFAVFATVLPLAVQRGWILYPLTSMAGRRVFSG